MLSTLFPAYLIGLREGLEAALVISILVAFLVKADRRDRLGAVWGGVIGAVVLSVAFGASLTFVWDNLDSFYAQELLGGTLSIIAVGFVTWMIFWMRKMARQLKHQLGQQLAEALTVGTTAIVVAAFLAVAREGLETTLFLWTTARASGQTALPLVGFLLGIVTAIILGWLIYLGAIRINLSRFFRITGVGLVLVAAGILAYGIYDLQEISLLPGLSTYAFDISHTFDATSWYGTLLKGIFNFQPAMTVWQVLAWLAYVGVVLTAFLMPARRPGSKPPARVPATAHPQAATTAPAPAPSSSATKQAVTRS